MWPVRQENMLGQKFIVDATLFVDLRKAGKSDNVHDTVSYADVYRSAEHHTYCLQQYYKSSLYLVVLHLQAHQDSHGGTTAQAIGISGRQAGH